MLSAKIDKLRESFSCVTYRGDQHTHILIEETDRLAKLQKISLAAPNGDWFSITPDKGRGKTATMSSLLAISDGGHIKHHHHCACDNVIFLIRDEKLTVIYIDLKSNNPTGYANQFKSTRQFVRYAIALIEEFHDQKLQITDERYVILYGGKPATLNKKTTVIKPERTTKTSPNSAYKREVLNGDRIYLKELLS